MSTHDKYLERSGFLTPFWCFFRIGGGNEFTISRGKTDILGLWVKRPSSWLGRDVVKQCFVREQTSVLVSGHLAADYRLAILRHNPK